MTAEAAEELALKMVLRCRDFGASRRFYSEILGLRVVEEWAEDEGRGCIFGFGELGSGGWFEIYEMTEQDPRYDAAFSRPLVADKIDIQLRTPSLEYWIDALTDRWPFDGPETLPWGQRWIKLRDPDNLLVAIYEDLR